MQKQCQKRMRNDKQQLSKIVVFEIPLIVLKMKYIVNPQHFVLWIYYIGTPRKEMTDVYNGLPSYKENHHRRKEFDQSHNPRLGN